MTAQEAGLLTLGYAITIVLFIRVGEKLLQRFGPRKPMIWGSLIVGAAILCLMPTHMLLDTYKIFAIIGYCLFGLGLAFYATPSTDAALSNLPEDQAGSGSGIYKMASSLGSAIGAAVSLAVFTSMAAGGSTIIGSVVEMHGRTDNVTLRQAGMFALAVNLVFALLAIISITMTVPKGGGSRDLGVAAASPAPEPQLPPDDEKRELIDRLSALSLPELREIEKQVLLRELADIDEETLRRLIETRRE